LEEAEKFHQLKYEATKFVLALHLIDPTIQGLHKFSTFYLQ